MTASPLIIPVARFFTISGGAGLAGGKVYTYEAGTNTPKATYTDYTANPLSQNTNPVILDSSGSAAIWLVGNYKINVTDSNDVQQPNYPVDGVSSFSSGSEAEYAVTTGSANTYVLTPSPAIISYTAGQGFWIKINATNTGPSTINISGLGAKSIVKLAATPLTGGELTADIIYRIVYDGTNFQILSSSIYGFKNANIASGATVDLSTVTGDYIHITGTTTITSFGTAPQGSRRTLEFEGALTLTHNATSLILPGGANITTAAGDTAIFVSEGSGNWRCIVYSTANALPTTTLPVSKGGTGVTSLTAYALMFGGTTSTGPVQSGSLGSANQVLTSNGAGALPTFQTLEASNVTGLIITKSFTSSQQTTTAGATYTLAHGMGVVPKFITCELVCITNDNSYTAGQVTYPSNGGAGAGGVGPIADSTNIYVVNSNISPSITRLSDGATITGTAASWKYVWSAWA